MEKTSIFDIILFIFNSFALAFIMYTVSVITRRMEKRLDRTIRFMRWVKARNDVTYMSMLNTMMQYFVKIEMYEDAARVKKLIEQEMKDMDIDGL